MSVFWWRFGNMMHWEISHNEWQWILGTYLNLKSVVLKHWSNVTLSVVLKHWSNVTLTVVLRHWSNVTLSVVLRHWSNVTLSVVLRHWSKVTLSVVLRHWSNVTLTVVLKHWSNVTLSLVLRHWSNLTLSLVLRHWSNITLQHVHSDDSQRWIFNSLEVYVTSILTYWNSTATRQFVGWWSLWCMMGEKTRGVIDCSMVLLFKLNSLHIAIYGLVK